MLSGGLTQAEITRTIQVLSNEIARHPDNEMLINELEAIIEKLSRMWSVKMSYREIGGLFIVLYRTYINAIWITGCS